MSLPSSAQNENKPESGGEPQHEATPEHEPVQGRSDARRAFASASAQQGSPVNIIPIAPLGWRLLAFILDGILVGLFAYLLLTRVLFPEYQPVGYSQWTQLRSEQSAAFNAAFENGEPMPPIIDMQWVEKAQTEEIREMLSYGLEITALIMLIYFMLCERILRGGSLGKSMLRLRVISLNTGRPPSIWESFLRGLIKVCPIINPLFVVSYFVVWANRMRRSGHDWLSNTVVVSDTGGYMPHVTEPRRKDEDEDEY